MTAMIDIVGIGDKIVTLPSKKDEYFEPLDNYYTIARKMISVHAPTIRTGLAEEMLANEDAVGNVAHALMMADWKFDGRGNRHGFRKKMGIFAIKNYISRQHSKKRSLSLDNILNVSAENSFAQTIPSKEQKPDEILEKQEGQKLLLSKIKQLLESDLISDQQAEYLRLYYFEGVSLSEIGKTRGVSKQSVSELIRKARRILRPYIENDKFFRGIIYED